MQSNRIFSKHKKRITSFYVIVYLFAFILLINFFYIQVIFSHKYHDDISKSTTAIRKVQGNRGSIYDRNGNLLAYSINKFRMWVNSKNLSNDKEIINFLNLTKNKKYNFDYNFINENSSYSVIIDDLIVYENEDLFNQSKKIKNLNCNIYKHRLYPYNELAAQLIGFTNYENQGRYGIEGYFNNILNGSEKLVEYNKNSRGKIVSPKEMHNINDGSDIHLTIDINIQDILQSQLRESLILNDAKSANGIIINPNTGDIIAMASLPDFDLNNYKKLPKDSANYYYTNRVISNPYEPGSTFKIVNMSNSIDESNNYKSKLYFCEGGEYTSHYLKPFRDHIAYDSLTFKQIFTNSSNIGTIKVFEENSKKSFYKKMQDFGFGIKTNISLKDENSGDIKDLKYYRNNSRDLASASIGQSILVTNLQIALAYGSVANGGFLLKPKIIQKIVNDKNITKFNKPTVVRRNIKLETSKYLLSSLKDVIEKGTGTKAIIKGVEIGGKTGTGEIWSDKISGYSSEEFISSFVSLFPISNPKYVMVVSIEAPSDYEKRWGGETAAPCSKNIIKNILLYDKDLRTDKNEDA